MKVRVYVAGPYTLGDSIEHCRNAFVVADVLRGLGYVPFVPHWMALATLTAPMTYEQAMAMCFAWLEVCNALLRLPGESSGADREMALAGEIGIPVFYSIEALRSHFEEAEAA